MRMLMTSTLALALLVAPGLAEAQTKSLFLAPYVGATQGGGDDARDGALTVGVAGGWMGARWGIEGDVADTQAFFTQNGFRTDRRVTTMMGNILVGIPVTGTESPWTVYAAAGGGLMRPRLTEAGGIATLDVTQPGMNVGGGVLWRRDSVGIRGDVRYFRAIGDEADDANPFNFEASTMQFVRITAGVVVAF